MKTIKTAAAAKTVKTVKTVKTAKRAAVKPAAKPAAAVKTATVTQLVKLTCDKCGRENNRAEGATVATCRNAHACKARVRAAQPVKAAKRKTA